MAPALAFRLPILMYLAAAQSCKEKDALCKETSSDGFQHLLQAQVAKKQNSIKNVMQGEKLMHQESYPKCGGLDEPAYYYRVTGTYICCSGLQITRCSSGPVCLYSWQSCQDFQSEKSYCAPNLGNAWYPSARQGKCCDGEPPANCDGTMVCKTQRQACPSWTLPSAAPTTTTTTAYPYCAPNLANAWNPSSRQGKCCDGEPPANCDGTMVCKTQRQACPSWTLPSAATTTTENAYCAPPGGNAWYPSTRGGLCCDGGPATNCGGTLYCLSRPGQPCPS